MKFKKQQLKNKIETRYFYPNACWLKSGLKSVKNLQNIVQKS